MKKLLLISLLLITLSAMLYTLRTIRQLSDVYIFGYPLVLMDLTRKAQVEQQNQNQQPAFKTNHFTHIQLFPDHSFRNVVRPNTDTLYSVAWLDLAAEPMILSVPDMQGRYYVMPLMDAWTNVDVSIGKRLSGTQAGDFLISGPNWQGRTPEGLKHIVANTNMNWIIGRIQTNGKADIPAVSKAQQRFFLTPLSRWSERQSNPNFYVKAARKGQRINPSQQLAEMSGAEFFDTLSNLMAQQPAASKDTDALKTIRRLGLNRKTGHGLLRRKLMDLAVDITHRKLREIVMGHKANENGWRVVRNTIGDYGTNYKVRTAAAMIGLGAIPPAEASYPHATADSLGHLLSGKHRYRLRFEPGQTPPANAFWSLSMYDKRGFFIQNSLGRYALGDRDPMTFNADGSLDILIQHKAPEDSTSNWLPAPENKFELTLRLYHPSSEFLEGNWQLPAIERLE